MIFVDHITISQKFSLTPQQRAEGRTEPIKPIAGLRRLTWREVGDVDRNGKVVEAMELVGESAKPAWIQGSHETAIQLWSDGITLSLSGNPGRFCRAENLFNLGFDETIARCNRIVADNGYPLNAFRPGEPDPYTDLQLATMELKSGETPEMPFTGSRVWGIHLTQNYATGSPVNAKAVIDWANTQSAARVKKRRLGPTTVVWGSLTYCQTELYIKADEMLDHCKSKKQRDEMRESAAYKYALDNGIIRLEVKCAKDYLKQKRLTYLGSWNMEKVQEIFRDKAQILARCKVTLNEDHEAWLNELPKAVRVHAAAWLKGIDVVPLMSRATFFRHAKVLREYGIDITEPRNVTVLRPTLRDVGVTPLAVPAWYPLAA